MTVAEYMDPARFPLTTQAGLEPRQQMMIDAFNYDDLAAVEEEGREMTPAETARWEELKVKRAAMPEVSAELKRQGSGS